MIPHKKNNAQIGFFSSFEDLLNDKHPLYILSNKIKWQRFETAFLPLYCPDNGRRAKPIRLMVGLLILKHLRNISDESVVEQWSENSYYQYFCGETSFVPAAPCEASELVHFRNRIGKTGMELIFKESIRINGDDSKEDNIKVDTTVQEKNISYPTDAKLHKKIIRKCRNIAQKEGVKVRQSYCQTLKKLSVDQRFRNHPKNKGKARKADKKIKTIAGRLVRELERNLAPNNNYQNDLALYKKVLAQQRKDKNKIYSLHEPYVNCIGKGKEHKQYEFGNKVSISVTENTGVIVGALSFSNNPFDGHTLPAVIKQYENIFGKAPKEITADRGYRGKKQINETTINTPKTFNQLSSYHQKKLRHQFRRRAAIEPVIGHLKTDHRLSRNFYKGIKGDEMNLLLSAAAFNFKRMMNKWKQFFLCLIQNLIFYLQNLLLPTTQFKILNEF
ncbi:MAG: IS5 family transposase [Phycisphaerales bacterium]|nr:IS5 family transposase [Phycisphaerales bacterium]